MGRGVRRRPVEEEVRGLLQGESVGGNGLRQAHGTPWKETRVIQAYQMQ